MSNYPVHVVHIPILSCTCASKLFRSDKNTIDNSGVCDNTRYRSFSMLVKKLPLLTGAKKIQVSEAIAIDVRWKVHLST